MQFFLVLGSIYEQKWKPISSAMSIRLHACNDVTLNGLSLNLVLRALTVIYLIHLVKV
jgi:hypothetical protein